MSHQNTSTRGGISGRSPRPDGRYSHRNTQVGGASRPFSNEDKMSQGRGKHPHHISHVSGSKHFKDKPTSNYEYRHQTTSPVVISNSLEAEGSTVKCPERFEAPDSFYTYNDLHSSSTQSNSKNMHPDVGANKPFAHDSFRTKDGTSQGRGKYSHHKFPGSRSKHFNDKPTSNYVYRPTTQLPVVIPNSLEAGGSRMKQPECIVASDSKTLLPDVSPNSLEAGVSCMKQPECIVASDSVGGEDIHSFSAHSDSKNIHLDEVGIQIGETPEKKAEDGATSKLDFSGKVKVGHMQESPPPAKADTKGQVSLEEGPKDFLSIGDSEHSVQQVGGASKPFSNEDRILQGNGKHPHHISHVSGSKHFKDKPTSNYEYRHQTTSPVVISNSLEAEGSTVKRPERFEAPDSFYIYNDLHSSSTQSNSKNMHPEVGANKPFAHDSFRTKDGTSQGRGKYSHHKFPGSRSKHFNDKPTSNYVYRPTTQLPVVIPNSLEAGGSRMKQPECIVASDLKTQLTDVSPNSLEAGVSCMKQPECVVASDSVGGDGIHSFSAHSDSKNIHLDEIGIQIGETPEEKAEGGATSKLDFSGKVKVGHMQESPPPAKADTKDQDSLEEGPKNFLSIGDSEHSVQQVGGASKPFSNEDRMLQGRGKHPHHLSHVSGSKHFKDKPTSNYEYRHQATSPVVISNSLEAEGSTVKRPERFEAPDSFYTYNDLHSSSTQSNSKNMHPDVGANKPFAHDSFRTKDGTSQGRGKYSHHKFPGSRSKHFNDKPTSNYVYRPTTQLPVVIPNSLEAGGSRMKQPECIVTSDSKTQLPDVSPNSLEAGVSCMKQPECIVASDSVGGDGIHSFSAHSDSKNIHLDEIGIQIGETPEEKAEGGATSKLDFSGKVKVGHMQESPPPAKADTKDQVSLEEGPKNFLSIGDSEHSVQQAIDKPFDLCPPKRGSVMLNPPLLVTNKQKRNDLKLSIEGQSQTTLRPGMVLLKKYLSISDQVNIVKVCRDLGLGPGGFYQPGYRDGANLYLKMMCLGKNWDPETSQYGNIRPTDGAVPPIIPAEFFQLVGKAIQDSRALIEEKSWGRRDIEAELPCMLPDICIANFYSATGKLGLHQDKDESRGSIDKGLPVVSFSIGDSAEFLYSDLRDVANAKKVILESGDVLIFGGKSRSIFHGVEKIIANTSPKSLLEETSIRPGRLNLTFRQY